MNKNKAVGALIRASLEHELRKSGKTGENTKEWFKRKPYYLIGKDGAGNEAAKATETAEEQV